MRKFSIIAVAFTMLFCVAEFASADVILQLNQTFQSGASFTGQLTFSDSFNNLLAVNGVLTSGSIVPNPDNITWVWTKGMILGGSYAGSGGGYYDFLMDGTPGTWRNYIEIDWAYYGQGNPVLNYQYLGNKIDNVDPMVSYAFSNVSNVPEPASLLLLSTGLGMIGLGAWKRKRA